MRAPLLRPVQLDTRSIYDYFTRCLLQNQVGQVFNLPCYGRRVGVGVAMLSLHKRIPSSALGSLGSIASALLK